MLNLPNILTLSRIALLPALIGLFFMEATWGAIAAWICLGLYILCAFTDFLDGYFARKMNLITPFGTFLDPIADKIFVAALLVTFVGFERLSGIWIIPVLVIFTREFLVSGLREYLGPYNVQLPVTKLAKWKTTLQMIATGILIIAPYIPYGFETGRWMLAIAAIITVITGWGYLKAGLTHMKKIN